MLATQESANVSVGADMNVTSKDGPQLSIIDDNIGALFITKDAPQSYREVMRRNNTNGWVEAIVEEYQNLCWKGIFIEVELPPDVHIHEGHLVFTEKVGSEGEITKKKAQLVVKGYTEVWGEDYWHTYSPTLGCDTLFSCLASVASQDLEIHQLDMVAAYLNSDLSEEIYLNPPEGVPSTPGTVWCLRKALYSLKQARLEWYHTLHGYAQSRHDHMLDSENFIVIYVNDLLLFAPKSRIMQAKTDIAGKYEMRDLGEACWFLVMEITCDRVAWTISIDQHQYIRKILGHFRLDKA